MTRGWKVLIKEGGATARGGVKDGGGSLERTVRSLITRGKVNGIERLDC